MIKNSLHIACKILHYVSFVTFQKNTYSHELTLPFFSGNSWTNSLKKKIGITTLTLQTANLEILYERSNNRIAINHLLLIFKFHVFKSHKKNRLNLDSLILVIRKYQKNKKMISFDNKKDAALDRKILKN